jgi:DNA-binding NarL/FixJ family response regulator
MVGHGPGGAGVARSLIGTRPFSRLGEVEPVSGGDAHRARPVRVLVVDDQRSIREGISSLLDHQPGVEVVGTAADGREAVERTLDLEPDVVLMDIRMPGMDGVDATAVVRTRAPGCRVLMLTTFDDEEYVVRALRAGASGYLVKDLPAADLARAVVLAHAGVHRHDPSVTERLVAALGRTVPGAPSGSSAPPGSGGSPVAPAALTLRELEVLRLLAACATNREIAKRLSAGEGTVKNHVSHILSRLGLRDRTQAARYAREHGLG